MIAAATRAPDHARSARAVWIFAGLATASRLVLVLRGEGASLDEARNGVNGLSLFHGEFPIYFAGQSFVGTAANVYLAWLGYVLLGVAPATLELASTLLSLAAAGLGIRLTWEAWGPRAAAFAALWLAVPPDFVLWWAQESGLSYHLTLVLGPLTLLLARRIPGASPTTAARRLLVLGLVSGLAYWTSFLSIVYLPAVFSYLILGHYRPRSLHEVTLPPLGFALGALPHLLYMLPRGSAAPPFEVGAGLAGILAHLRNLARAWPILLGVPVDLPGPVVLVLTTLVTALYIGLVAIALAVTGNLSARRAWESRSTGRVGADCAD